MSNISILGCGWLGKPLALEFIQKGYQVIGSTTSEEKLSVLKSEGIPPVLFNMSTDFSCASPLFNSDVLIIAITSKSIEDYEKLIACIERSKVHKVIFISSTSVYPNTNGTVNEETVVKPTPLAAIEKLFISNTTFKTTVIRFAGLFGYNRKPGNFVRPGKSMANPDGYINLIHQDDCIAIITQIVEKDIWNEVFNACSDSHPTRRAFYTKEAFKLNKPTPVFDEISTSEYKIVSNEKLKLQLGYEFKYADLMDYNS